MVESIDMDNFTHANSIRVAGTVESSGQGILLGRVTEMPTAVPAFNGATVLYDGSEADYTKGRFYTCDGTAWNMTALDLTQILSGKNMAMVTNANGAPTTSSKVSVTELEYLDGVTSDIQGQLDSKVPSTRTVNGKPLSANIALSAADVDALPDTTTLAGMTNDAGFITNLASDLVNYYSRSVMDDKIATINNNISAIPKFTIAVVASLPGTGDSATIYLMPKTGTTGDVHDEYIYVSGKWELIGSTQVDLSDYYTKSEVNAKTAVAQSASGISVGGTALQIADASKAGLMSKEQVSTLSTTVSRVSTCESDIAGLETGKVDTIVYDSGMGNLQTNKLDKAGGTMTGVLVAQANTQYSTAQVRNVILSTSEPTSADGSNGTLWAVYE